MDTRGGRRASERSSRRDSGGSEDRRARGGCKEIRATSGRAATTTTTMITTTTTTTRQPRREAATRRRGGDEDARASEQRHKERESAASPTALLSFAYQLFRSLRVVRCSARSAIAGSTPSPRRCSSRDISRLGACILVGRSMALSSRMTCAVALVCGCLTVVPPCSTAVTLVRDWDRRKFTKRFDGDAGLINERNNRNATTNIAPNTQRYSTTAAPIRMVGALPELLTV